MPVDLTRLSYQHEIRLRTGMNDQGFPQAHTCFFQIDLPFYRTDELMAKRIM